MRSIILAALVCGCGGGPKTTIDLCQVALKEGPPASLECPDGTERVTKIERSQTIPSASGRSVGINEVAETAWCVTPEGISEGPVLAFDRRRRVVRSGTYVAGIASGNWIAWGGGGMPVAVTVFGADGSLESEKRCQL